MKIRLLGIGALMLLLTTLNAQAQTLGGALNKVKNVSKDVKSTKDGVDGALGKSKDPSSKPANTGSIGGLNNNQKGNIKMTDTRNQEPRLAFIKDLENEDEAKEFNANEPIIFVFDYGMDLQKFFDKYVVDENSFNYKLSIQMENGTEIFKAENFVSRYPVKESGPIVELLQLGDKYVDTEMKPLAQNFPMAVLEHLTQGTTINLKYTFEMKKDLVSPPVFNESGTLKYNYRVSDRKTLVNHLEGYYRQKYDINTVDVAYTDIQKNNLGKIRFGKGSPNKNEQNQANFVNTIDLSSPFYYNAYLEQTLWNYDVVNNAYMEGTEGFYKNFYIDNVLIAKWYVKLDEEVYKNQTIYSDVVVPANQNEFLANEMEIGVLAHVFSTLSPGVHKFKVEFVVIKSTANSGSSDSGFTYENAEIPVATGEVDVKIDQAALDNYTKKYGRPKIGKGVLEGQAALEKQVIDLIKRTDNLTPIYVYADDSWKINRGAFDQIISREVRGFYVFKNSTGRCEIADFVIFQDYEGSSYGAPKHHISRFGKSFKYAVCSSF